MAKLTHIDDENRAVMVDVGDKAVTRREATAESRLRLPPELTAQIAGGELMSKKGPVLATAVIAGVMAAKRAHELIPFCHPLGLDHCDIDIRVMGEDVVIRCRCRVDGKTGVEMEALTGASVAALTLYDMIKALSPDLVIRDTRLLAKTGGKRDFRREDGQVAT